MLAVGAFDEFLPELFHLCGGFLDFFRTLVTMARQKTAIGLQQEACVCLNGGGFRTSLIGKDRGEFGELEIAGCEFLLALGSFVLEGAAMTPGKSK